MSTHVSKLMLLCIALNISFIISGASECLFVTGVNCPTNCDDNSLYKTCDGDLYGKTFFSFRPQDSDSSRRILGWFNKDHKIAFFKFKKHVILTISPQYTRSFDTNDIAQWFFFNGRDRMSVGIPSATESFDIDGEQIGLSLGTIFDEYENTISPVVGKIGNVWAKPLVENYIVDVDLWCDLSAWHDDLWSRIEFPIVNMKTNMRMRASGKGTQNDEYVPGLFSLESTPFDGYEDYACNATPVPYSSILCALDGNQGWGAVEPLKSGKFSPRGQSKWGVAGLHFDLGYDIYDTAPWYCAGSIHVVFPTGTRPKGTYVLEPVIGANKSWQVGATAIARYIKEFGKDELGVYFYGVGTHLFKAAQDRVFSLITNGPGSQLLLLKQFNSSASGLINAEREANIFCGRTKIGSAFMFDGSLMLQWSRKEIVVDLGYNFWIRTKEKRSKSVLFRGFYENQLGIKGSTPMEDKQAVESIYAPLQCLPDLTTDHCVTIAGGSFEADNPAVFIKPCNVNYGSALAPTSMSNKVFAAIGYKSSWFILLSGEAEFGISNAAINQYGVMLKIGKDF